MKRGTKYSPTVHISKSAICALALLLGLASSVSAIPATADAELAALRISNSDMETDLGAETVYRKLEQAARRACDAGFFQDKDMTDPLDSACILETLLYYIETIGNPRLMAVSKRNNLQIAIYKTESRPEPYQKLSNLTVF